MPHKYKAALVTCILGFAGFLLVDPALETAWDQSGNPWPPPADALDISTAGLLSPQNILYFVAVFAMITTLGFICLRPLWSKLNAPGFASFLGSFWAGYLAILALYRLVNLVLISPAATWGTLAGAALICAIEFWRKPPGWQRPTAGTAAWLAGSIIILFIFAVVEYLYTVLGEGPGQYQYLVRLFLRSDVITHFPFILQHYDEVFFSFFILSPFKPQYHPIWVAWMALLMNKLSILAFLILIFRGTTTWLFALAVSSYYYWGSLILNPFKKVWLFDSNNPLSMTMHSGRILGAPLVCLLIYGLSPRGRDLRLSPLTLILLGVGIALTSLTNATTLIAVLVFCALAYGASTCSYSKRQPLWLLFTAAVFAGPMLAYYEASAGVEASLAPSWVPGWPFVFSFLGIAGLLGLLFTPGRTLIARLTLGKRWWILFAAMFIGLLFLGNFTTHNPVAEAFWDWVSEHTHQLYPMARFENKGGMLQSQTPIHWFADARELEEPGIYNRGALHFFSYYGLMLLIALGFVYRICSRKGADYFALVGLMAYSYLCVLFLYVDFVNDVPRSWIKTRFLEAPLYTVLFCGFMTLGHSLSERHQKMISPLLFASGAFLLFRFLLFAHWTNNLTVLRTLFNL